MNKISIAEYLDTEYSQAALYNCYRMLASYVDGQKPSSRKVVYTIKKRGLNSEEKVSIFAPSVAGSTEYLHGDVNLQGVIVNMVQDFVGSNNMPLLEPIGNFGSRHVPNASAPRYIFVKKSKNLDLFFSKLDDEILIEQEFEGKAIEPKFFVPVVPLILVNGSEGLGTGFAQKILPRKMDDVIEALKDILDSGDTLKRLKPYYKGFRGKISNGALPNSWEISGSFKRINTSTIEITEVPIGYNLAGYLKVLNKLVEDKVIKSFEDCSENDKFNFIIKTTRDFVSKTDDEILNDLKLIKRVTENYTCISENNEVIVFDTSKDILKEFIRIRLEYYQKRKDFMIEKITEDIKYLESTLAFVEGVIKGNIVINNIPKRTVERNLDDVENIIRKDGSYDYLLKMPLYSLTKERFSELKNKIRDNRKELNYYTRATTEKMFVDDLEGLSGKER